MVSPTRLFLGTSSESVVSCSVRTIEKRTRVHSSLVGQRCPGSVSRAHTIWPSGSAVMHSIGAMEPSSASTTSAIVISSAERASRYPPRAPRRLSTSPALRNRATRCSRYASGSPLASAISASGTGLSPDRPASSTRTRMPYSALVENIMAAKTYLAGRVSVAVAAAALFAAPAQAETVDAGAQRAVVQAEPFSLSFTDASGREVLGGGALPGGDRATNAHREGAELVAGVER